MILTTGLLFAIVWQFPSVHSLFERRKLNTEQIAGEKASLVTMAAIYDKDKLILDSLNKDGGSGLKKEWESENQRKLASFEQYRTSSKEWIQRKKEGLDDDGLSKIKQKQLEVISLGEYRDVEFFRGTNWEMIFYVSLPDFTSDIPSSDMIGILDEEGRTVAALQVMYNNDNHTFELLSAETTLEWLKPTDVYQYGSSEVGIPQKETGKSGNKE